MNGPDGCESDDTACEVQADDGKVVYIREHFKEIKEGEIEEGEFEEDEVDQGATSSCKRKTPTKMASINKRGPEKVGTRQKAGTKKALTRKKPRNTPKPLTPIKKAPSKKPLSAT